MKRIALIELTVMVDENSPWRNIAHFEQFFDDFATAHGMEVDDVEVRGNASKLVKYVTKLDEPATPNSRSMTFKTPTPVKGK